jgi:AcrR family transcriptional regulator
MTSPTRPSKEDVLTAFRRSALLESARRVFGECGFERATMERIAHEAGVAKGTIYLYYSSKQRMYDEALNEGLAELDGMTRVRVEQAPTLRDAIAAFISARTDYFLERREFFRMYVAAVAGHITERHGRPSEFRSLITKQTRRLEARIARGMDAGEIRDVDPAATARAIFDLTRGLVARKLFLGRGAAETAHPDEAEFLTTLIWDGLGPDRRPGTPRTAAATRKKTMTKRQR